MIQYDVKIDFMQMFFLCDVLVKNRTDAAVSQVESLQL